MTRAELRDFIISEVKANRPEDADRAAEIADRILGLRTMQSEASIKGFLKGYLGQ